MKEGGPNDIELAKAKEEAAQMQIEELRKKVASLEAQLESFKEVKNERDLLCKKLEHVKNHRGNVRARVKSNHNQDNDFSAEKKREAIIEGLKRRTRWGKSSFRQYIGNKTHTLRSAKTKLRQGGYRFREIEVRLRWKMVFGGSEGRAIYYKLAIQKQKSNPYFGTFMNLEIAPYSENLDFTKDTTIRFESESHGDLQSGEAELRWKCLIYETPKTPELFWVLPSMGMIGRAWYWMDNEIVELIHQYVYEKANTPREFTKFSDTLGSFSEVKQNDGVTSLLSDGLYLMSASQNLLELLQIYGMLDADLEYDTLYWDSMCGPAQDPLGPEILLANSLADNPHELKCEDPRVFWRDLKSASDTLRLVLSGDDPDVVTTINNAADLLSDAYSCRVSMQNLIVLAYEVGLEKRSNDIQNTDGISLLHGRKFREQRSFQKGRRTCSYTEFIHDWIIEFHKEQGKWPTHKPFKEYMTRKFDDGECPDYEEYRVEIENRHVFNRQNKAAKDQ